MITFLLWAACATPAPAPAPARPAPTTPAPEVAPVVHDDPALLQRMITLPEGVTGARWVSGSVTPPSRVPGPTDHELTAFVALPDAQVAAHFGPGRPPRAPWRLPLAQAQALLPPELVVDDGSGTVSVDGIELRTAKLQGPWHATSVRHLPGHGLLLHAMTM